MAKDFDLQRDTFRSRGEAGEGANLNCLKIVRHRQTIVTTPRERDAGRNIILIPTITDENTRATHTHTHTHTHTTVAISLRSFFVFLFFSYWPISRREFSSIILDFCPPLCYAGYVGNVARNLEMVRGLQSPIFRGARNSVGFWDHSLFLFPNLSLSSSPASRYFSPITPPPPPPPHQLFYIFFHLYFFAYTLLPTCLVRSASPCLFPLLPVSSPSLEEAESSTHLTSAYFSLHPIYLHTRSFFDTSNCRIDEIMTGDLQKGRNLHA